MEREQIFEAVQKATIEILRVEADAVTEEANFQDDLNADSLDLVELVDALQDEFDVKIPDEDMEKLKSVGDAVDYIEEKL